MKNKELIKRLLEFPMDAEVRIDLSHSFPYSLNEIADVGWDDDKTKVWITNYK